MLKITTSVLSVLLTGIFMSAAHAKSSYCEKHPVQCGSKAKLKRKHIPKPPPAPSKRATTKKPTLPSKRPGGPTFPTGPIKPGGPSGPTIPSNPKPAFKQQNGGSCTNVAPRKCPDGTTVSCTETCKGKTKPGRIKDSIKIKRNSANRNNFNRHGYKRYSTNMNY